MIFYLSGTGNTRWAAKMIAEATGERLLDVAQEVHTDCIYTLTEDERIGFCFPVHGWRPPKLLRKFISKLHIQRPGGHYTWALCTCGDDIGLTMQYLDDDLERAGLPTTECQFSITMPESYVGLPFMDVDPPEKEMAKLTVAERQMPAIVETIVEYQSVVQINTGGWKWAKSHIIGSFFAHHLITDRPFRVVTDRCITCGTCAKVCPVNNIEGGKGSLPAWKHSDDCLVCFNCYHHCPTHAIEYGNRTKNKGQYYFK